MFKFLFCIFGGLSFSIFATDVKYDPNATMEQSHLNREIQGASQKIKSALKEQPLLCRTAQMLLGKDPQEIIVHYEQLVTTVAGTHTNPEGTSIGDGAESYAPILKLLSLEDLKELGSKWKQILKYINDNSFSKKISREDFQKKMGLSDRQLLGLFVFLDHYGKEIPRTMFLNKNQEYIKIQEERTRLYSKYRKFADYNSIVFEKFYKKYPNVDADVYRELGLKEGDELSDDQYDAVERLIEKKILEFSEVFYKGQEGLDFSHEEWVEQRNDVLSLSERHRRLVEKILRDYPFDDDEISAQVNSLYGHLGIEPTNNYKFTSGLVNASYLMTQGYSDQDIHFALSRAALSFEAADMLYDHLGLESKKYNLADDGGREFEKHGSAYQVILKEARDRLKKDPEFFRRAVGAMMGLESVKDLIPPVDNAFIESDVGMNALILALYSANRRSFDRYLGDLFAEKKIGAKASVDLLFLLEAGKKDILSVLEGTEFALREFSGLRDSKNLQWPGIFTSDFQRKLRQLCKGMRSLNLDQFMGIGF